MDIRQATPIDARPISSLVKSLAHYYLDDADNDLPEWLANTLTEDAFLQRINSSEYNNFLCEQDGQVIGYGSMKKPNHLYHLFVAEAFQGKGISRKLWEQLIAEESNATYTLRSSIFAIPVYERFGFKAVGERGTKDGVSFQPMAFEI